MSIFYSAARRAFFDDRVHATLPGDAAPVTAEEHARLLAEQSAGKVITPGDDGAPIARRPAENGEQLRARLIVATKREAARRIEAVAPIWRQMNDVAALARATSAGIDAPDEIWSRCDEIDRLRAASDRLEARLAGMAARQLAKADIANDTHWIQGEAA